MVPAVSAQHTATISVPLNAFQMVVLNRMPMLPYRPFSVMFSLVTHHLSVRLF